MRKGSKSILVLALSWPLSVFATNYPVEFSDFFTSEDDTIIVRLAGDTVGLKVDGLVSYESFRLSEIGVAPLRRYLSDKGLSSNAVDTISNELTSGVPANPGCKVNLDVCVPEVSGEDVAYVFDYDNGNLSIFVGSDLLVQAVQDIIYHPAHRANNGLVNQARLYGYSDGSSNSGVSISNLTTLGLPYGHMVFNTQYQSADSSLDIYKAVYDLEVEGTRGVFGYTGRDPVFFNTTDFLNDDADYSSYSAQIGTSRNLVRGGSERLQSVFFFAPQEGQLEVYQGERMLLTKVVSQGRQSIAYDDLPAGAYDVRLVLRAGGQIVLEELRQIVNSQQFSLPVGEWDYVFTTGQFYSQPMNDELEWLNYSDEYSKNYTQLRASWRLTDSLLLAGSLTSNYNDYYTQAGVSYAWSDWLLATYQGGIFSSGDVYQAGSVTLGPFFMSVRRFDTDKNNRTYRLSSQLYDEQSFYNYSASYSTSLWGGSGYLTYTHYNSDAAYTVDELRTEKVDDFSAGWMTTWQGVQLGLSTTYSQNQSYDEVKFGLTASYALDSGMTGQFSMTKDRQGISRSEVGISKSMARGDWSGSGTVSLASLKNQPAKTEASLSGTLNGRSNWFNASGYGYLSSADRNMVSATLTGSQFISRDGMGMTPEMSSSFMNIVPDIAIGSSDKQISLDGVNYNVRRGANSSFQGRMTGDSTVIPLTPYTDTEFVMDAESRKLHIDNNIRREFVYPGTVYTIDARITPMVTQLFVLNDIHGQPIKQVRCMGDACAGVEPVSDDGVFRVSYKVGGQFTLVSMNRVCINEPGLERDGAIQTYCLPGLMSEEGRIAFSSTIPSQASDQLYLGKYESRQEAQEIINRLKEVGLVAQSVAVGQSLYLYVQYSQAFNVAQRAMLEGLEAYIVLNDANVDKLFSAR